MHKSLKTRAANCRNFTEAPLDILRIVPTGAAPKTRIFPCLVPLQ